MTGAKPAKRTKQLNRSFTGNLGVYTVLAVLGAFMLLPLIYTLVSSVKPLEEYWIFPPKFTVSNPTLKNFKELFSVLSDSKIPFSRYLFNTVLISFIGTGGHVILASMCAFALAKHQFPGAKIMFRTVVLALMFNATVTRIPNFIIMSKLNLIDTYWALIVPAFGSSLGLYLMKQFMDQMVNDSVLESARMDGAGEFAIFWKIVMPMVKPAWLTLIIFSFRDLWNIGSNTFIQSEQFKTLNYAMSQVLAGGVARAGAGAAACVIMMIVPITVFIITQSNVVETMGTSGMKE
ncbi:MAG: carbohydrate ABC transporter permease [Clostridia bacterium]|nr:carbohydrate ABC transporter permease [Clostridia bacterium]